MRDLTWLKEFGRFLTFRIKRRVMISVVVLATIPSTILFHFPLELRYFYAISFTLLATVPIFSTIQLVTGSTIELIKIVLYNRKHKPQEIHYPEVKRIAKEMGLDYDRPIYATDNPNVNCPYVNLFSKKITIPLSWLTKYHRSEILATIGHELGHIKNHGKYSKEMILASFAPVGFIFSLAFIIQILGLFYIPIFIQIGSYTFMMLILSYVFWRNEYRADKESAKTVGAAPLIAVLEMLQNQVKKDEGSDTHPPLHDRIRRLESFL